MSDFERLERLLRKHGFIVGNQTEDDRIGIEGLLKDLWAWLDAVEKK